MIRSMKTMVAALGVTAMLAGASAAQAASNVVIDLDGPGGNDGQVISAIDLNTGNTLAVGGTVATAGDSFDVYFQSTVSALNLAGGGVVAGVGTTYHLTTVVKFSEQISAGGVGTGGASFTEGTGNDEYFELWLSSTPANDLTGEGFGSDNAGAILLLAGSSVNVAGGGFNVFNVPPTNLDQTSDGNQYPGVQTVSGAGATSLSTQIDYVNTDYIRGINEFNIITFVLANPASSATPFDAVNPAAKFWDASTNSYYVPTIGAVNGVPQAGGTDFQFQTNGNLTFQTAVIPEPATAAMGLFGLAGLALAARRRR